MSEFDLTRWVDAWRWHARAGGPEAEHEALATAILELLDPAIVYDDVTAHAVWTGKDAVRDMFKVSYQFCPNLEHVPHTVQANDGKYCIEWEMRGVGGSALGDLPPHDRPFQVKGVSTGRYGAGGLVTHHYDYWNLMDWLGQIGQSPSGDVLDSMTRAAAPS